MLYYYIYTVFTMEIFLGLKCIIVLINVSHSVLYRITACKLIGTINKQIDLHKIEIPITI